MEFIFLELLAFCFFHVSYVDVFVTFLVICVLGLLVLPEERSSLLLNHSVFVLSVFVTMEKVLVNAADITHVQPLSENYM